MTNVGVTPPKPTKAISAPGSGEPSYPKLRLEKPVTGLEGLKPGDEVTLVVKCCVTGVNLGDEYGPKESRGKQTTTLDVYEVGVKGAAGKVDDKNVKEMSSEDLAGSINDIYKDADKGEDEGMEEEPEKKKPAGVEY